MLSKLLHSSRRRTLKKSRLAKKPTTLVLEQLENRLTPAGPLDALPYAALGPGAMVALQSGGAVGPLSIVDYPAPIEVANESDSGTRTDSGIDQEGVPFVSQTNWSYTFSVSVSGDGVRTESYHYSFDTYTTPADPSGLDNHEWGTFLYIFTWSGSAAASEFTMTVDLTRYQAGSLTTEADGLTSSMTTTFDRQENYHRVFTNQTDLSNGAADATDVGNGTDSAGSIGTGTYSWDTDGGTVSGTQSALADEFYGYSFNTTVNRDAGGALTFAGTWDDSATGNLTSSYSGSGAYDASGGDASSWWTGTGTITEYGSETWIYNDNTHYALAANGAWAAVSGSASSTLTTITDWTDNASGDYCYETVNAMVEGTWSEGSREHSVTTNTQSAILTTDDIWISTGAWDNVTSGGFDSSYSGGATYDLSGGDANYFWTGTGTITESGSEDWDYSHNSHYALLADGTWVVVSGSGLGDGDKTTHWSETGSGDYAYLVEGGQVITGTWSQGSNDHATTITNEQWTLAADDVWHSTGTSDTTTNGGWNSSYTGGGSYTVTGGVGDYTWTGTATITESGNADWTYNYNQRYAETDGVWTVLSGTGSGSGSDISDWDNTASGSYTYLIPGGQVSGTWDEANHEHSETDQTETWTLSPADVWITTGTWDNTTNGGWNSSYDGGGSYSASGSDGSYSWTANGTITESGSEDWIYNYGSAYDLLADGTWVVVDGSGAGSGGGMTDWTDDATGSYSYFVDGGQVDGTWEQGSNEHADYNETRDWTLSEDDIWIETGTSDEAVNGGWYSSFEGSGTYDASGGDAFDGWTGTGTITESGNEDWTYNFSSAYDLEADGAWVVVSGSGIGTGGGMETQTNSASGAYHYGPADERVTGTWSESTDLTFDYTETHNWTLGADDVWITTGTWDGNTSGGAHSSYNGGGTYDASGGDAFFGWTGAGTITESGNEDWTYDYGSSYDLLADGTWVVVGGSGSGTGTGAVDWTNDASGSYHQLVSGGQVNGTWDAGNHQHAEFTETQDYELTPADVWITTGTWDGDADGGSYFSYNGSGTYTIDGGIAPGSFTGTGTITESGSEDWNYNWGKSYDLEADGDWVVVGGSGTGTRIGAEDYSNEASGAYTYPVNGGQVNGTWAEGSNHSFDYTETHNWTLGQDDVWDTTATWVGSTDGGGHASFDGSGTYQVNSGDPSTSWVTGSGTITESGNQEATYSFDSAYELGEDGIWDVVSGSGTGNANSLSDWSDNASGSYGYAVVGGQVTGTWTDDANESTHSTETRNWTLSPENVWIATGTWSGGENGGAHSSYTGSGSYVVSVGTPGSGSWTTGSGTISEDGHDDYTRVWNASYNLLADGTWVVVSGSGTATGDAATNWSYTASGSYGHPLDGGALTGTWNANGDDNTTATLNLNSTLNANDTWTQTGQEARTHTTSDHSSYLGSGSYSTSSSDSGSDEDSTWGSSSSFSSNRTENGSDDSTFDESITVVFAADGTSTTTTITLTSDSSQAAYAYDAGGSSDSWMTSSGPGYDSHSESHNDWSQTMDEAHASVSESDYTTVSDPAGTRTVGSSSSSHDSSGNQTYHSSSSSSSYSNSWSTGGAVGGAGMTPVVVIGGSYSSHSEDSSSSTSDSDDHYVHHSESSSVTFADGTQSSSASGNSHCWGNATYVSSASSSSNSSWSGDGGSGSSSSNWWSNSNSDDHYDGTSSWFSITNPDGTSDSGSTASGRRWGSSHSDWGDDWSWTQTDSSGITTSDSGGSSDSSDTSYDDPVDGDCCGPWFGYGFGGPSIARPAQNNLLVGGGLELLQAPIGGGLQPPAPTEPPGRDPKDEKKNAQNYFKWLDWEFFPPDLERRIAAKPANVAELEARLTLVRGLIRLIELGLAVQQGRATPAQEALWKRVLADATFKRDMQAVSKLQMELIEKFFPGAKKGEIDWAAFQKATEMFNNFEFADFKAAMDIIGRRVPGVTNVPGGPNSAIAHARWYLFAQIAIDLGIDADFWKKMQPILLEGTDITQTILEKKTPAPLKPDEIAKIRKKYDDMKGDPKELKKGFDDLLGRIRPRP